MTSKHDWSFTPVILDKIFQCLSHFSPTCMMCDHDPEASGNGMAVVCRAGVSRSACLALAALVGQPHLKEMTLRHAYHTVKAARPLIRPNNGFFSQVSQSPMLVKGIFRFVGKMLLSLFESGWKSFPEVFLLFCFVLSVLLAEVVYSCSNVSFQFQNLSVEQQVSFLSLFTFSLTYAFVSINASVILVMLVWIMFYFIFIFL